MYIDSAQIISETINNISKIGSALFNSMISSTGGILLLLLLTVVGILKVSTNK